MIELVPAEEKAFEMGPRYKMVGLGQPPGHAVVVGVFCFESGLEENPRDRSGKRSVVPAQASVGPDPPECGVAVGDQSDTIAGVCEYGALNEGRFRRTESRPDEIIIEIRRSQGELGLL